MRLSIFGDKVRIDKETEIQSAVEQIAIPLVIALVLAACGVSNSQTTLPTNTLPIETATTTPSNATPTSILVSATRIVPTTTPMPFDSRVHLYDYDQKKSLDIQEKSGEEKDGIQIHDISFAGEGNRRVPAYLVTPIGKGPFAGIIWVHWLGVPNGNRTEFLEEAVAYAKSNVASLLIDGYFPWQKPPTSLDADRSLLVEQTIDIRRAFDLFLARPEIDSKRIAYVGHDFGAMYGAILAGVDKRAKTYVLEAGTTTFSDWFLTYWSPAPPDRRLEYQQSMVAFDPVDYIAHATPAALFFQFSMSDRFVPKATAEQFYEAASDPKKLEWYPVTHQMKSDDVTKERLDWLTQYLQ